MLLYYWNGYGPLSKSFSISNELRIDTECFLLYGRLYSLRAFDRLTVSPFGDEKNLVRMLSFTEFEQKEIALISF